MTAVTAPALLRSSAPKASARTAATARSAAVPATARISVRALAGRIKLPSAEQHQLEAVPQPASRTSVPRGREHLQAGPRRPPFSFPKSYSYRRARTDQTLR